MSPEDLMETLAVQNFYLKEHFDYTHSLLFQVANHFQSISQTINEVELYDHSVKVN